MFWTRLDVLAHRNPVAGVARYWYEKSKTAVVEILQRLESDGNCWAGHLWGPVLDRLSGMVRRYAYTLMILNAMHGCLFVWGSGSGHTQRIHLAIGWCIDLGVDFWLEGLERAIGWCIHLARHEPARMDSAGCSSGSAQHAPKKVERNVYSFFRWCSTLDCIHREKRIWDVSRFYWFAANHRCYDLHTEQNRCTGLGACFDLLTLKDS